MSSLEKTEENDLVKLFISLLEDRFTKDVIIPLFTAMGYYPIDYYGGRDEGGKDLICWKTDDFDSKELTVIQIKKVNASASASMGNSFAGLVSQLQQAKEKKVPDLDGLERIPNFVIFITPYQINVRALQSRFEAHSSQSVNGVKVYDGTMIATQLLKRLPNLANELLGKKETIKNSLSTSLTNLPLLNSLNYRDEKDYKDFYIDLDFGVGKINSSVFLDWTFKPKVLQLSLSPTEYSDLEGKIKSIEEYLSTQYLFPSREQIQNEYDLNLKKFESVENKKNLERLEVLDEELADLSKGYVSLIDSINQHLSIRLNTGLNSFQSEERMEPDESKIKNIYEKLNTTSSDVKSTKSILNKITHIISSINIFDELSTYIESSSNFYSNENTQKKRGNKKSESEIVSSLLDSVKQNHEKIKATSKARTLLRAKLIESPLYQISIDGTQVAERLEEKQHILRKDLSAFSKEVIKQKKLKEVLLDYAMLFKILDKLLAESKIKETINPEETETVAASVDSIRNHIPINEVFNTGINIAIIGDAGAGKSTTLEMFARKCYEMNSSDKLTLFLPLTKVVSPQMEEEKDHFSALEKGILNYINNVQNKSIQLNQLREIINGYEKSVFIFDGVDEVARTAPWIVEAINKLVEVYRKSQVIMSSRIGGKYLSEIKFLTITVLPFTDKQLTDFITGWFKNDPSKILEIKNHLKNNKSVDEVVRNPLLATILCTLAESNVPLPTKEISLYKERIKLLLGHYDIHKQAKRLESHHEILEAVTRKIAYKLHTSTKRMDTKEKLIEMARVSLGHIYSNDQLELAVTELISSCNILTLMSSDSEFGFGHLRYQEHLAAEEIVKDRGIEIPPLLYSQWWRSVMVLFAQMTDNFYAIFESQLEAHIGLGKTAATIEAMLAVRSEKERKNIGELIKRYKKIDVQEEEDFFYD